MQRALLVLLLMLSMVVSSIQVVTAASDQFVVLDPYDPRGINDRGDIAGGFIGGFDAEGVGHGVLLSHNTVTLIDAPAAACNVPQPEPVRTLAFALGLNDRDQVVGRYQTSVLGPTGCQRVRHGFFWSDGVFTPIEAPDGGALTLTGINNAGNMVGFIEGCCGIQGGVLVSEGTFTTLVVPDNPDIPVPYGISNRGDIVGIIGGDAFLLSRGRYTLFRVSESGSTEAHGINDRGDIAGFWLDAEGTTHGYVLSQGELTELHVPAGTIILVSGINNQGEVVGLYADETGTPHGFLLQVR